MAVFRTIVLVAALSGLIAGIVLTVAHEVATVPIILSAETYEKAAEKGADRRAGASPTADHASAHDSAASAWAPHEGLERKAFTALADILTGIGFALLLVSAYALRGGEVNWRTGLYWGLAGFASVTLAPGLGLPPTLPGAATAPLADRQLWWSAAAVATACGLALLFLGRRAIWAVAGLVLLVLPHIVGAPQPAEFGSVAPATLAHRFVVAGVLSSLLFWIALGSLSGALYKRLR